MLNIRISDQLRFFIGFANLGNGSRIVSYYGFTLFFLTDYGFCLDIEQIRTPWNFLLEHGKREYFGIFVDPNLNQNILEFVDLVNIFCGLSDLP